MRILNPLYIKRHGILRKKTKDELIKLGKSRNIESFSTAWDVYNLIYMSKFVMAEEILLKTEFETAWIPSNTTKEAKDEFQKYIDTCLVQD